MGGRTDSRPIHNLLASSAFVSNHASLALCCKGSGSITQGYGWKVPIWGLAENCAILRDATMAFAKSRLQRWIFSRLALVPERSYPEECVFETLRQFFAAEYIRGSKSLAPPSWVLSVYGYSKPRNISVEPTYPRNHVFTIFLVSKHHTDTITDSYIAQHTACDFFDLTKA